MKSNASQSLNKSSSKQQGQVLGKSAATGRFVLVPATSKGATISFKDVDDALKNIRHKTK